MIKDLLSILAGVSLYELLLIGGTVIALVTLQFDLSDAAHRASLSPIGEVIMEVITWAFFIIMLSTFTYIIFDAYGIFPTS